MTIKKTGRDLDIGKDHTNPAGGGGKPQNEIY